ncbi:hypothetical protein SBV1_1500028 [Verrucomicrobia bacterium]|nr:hypothetical protein SBV1_1500028 [Verrucomicrobiota bacterium]
MSNETKVAQLVLAHHAFVKALAFKLAPWPGLVDDISQQVFLEFLAKQEKWNLDQDLRPLLATMTRLVAARWWDGSTVSPLAAKAARSLRATSPALQKCPNRADPTP